MLRTYDIPDDKVAAIDAVVTAMVGAQAVPVSVPTRAKWAYPGYPRQEVFAGMHFYLKAPLSPRWKVSMNSLVLSGNLGSNGERLLADPSNTDDYHTPRSPLGYPLFYGKEPVPGATMGETQVVERMTPSVQFDGQNFPNDAAVEAYRTRPGANLSAEEINAQNAANTPSDDVLQPGQIAVASLNYDDVKMWWFNSVELVGFLGPRNAEKALSDWLVNGSTSGPPGLPNLDGLDRSFVYNPSAFNWQAYRGPILDEIARRRNK